MRFTLRFFADLTFGTAIVMGYGLVASRMRAQGIR